MYKITDLLLRPYSVYSSSYIWITNCVSDVNVKEESQLPFTSFGKEEAEKKDTEEKGEGNAIPSAETDEKSASSNLVRWIPKILSAWSTI